MASNSAFSSIKFLCLQKVKFFMLNSAVENDQRDWAGELNNLAYAFGGPKIKGQIKASPEDFCVTEQLEVVPSGVGEHYWLHISKIKCNTDRLAKELAKFANVAPRDVGYSGMKDFFAVTEQWFSIWLPGVEPPNWREFDYPGVTINRIERHGRKIKRGTHKSNLFKIQIRDVDGAIDSFMEVVELIKIHGVPNYFGSQRFGRNANNMNQVLALFCGGRRPKNRSLYGLLLSAARSWVFNKIVSARVEQKSWQTLLAKEPACLDGSNSVFISDAASDETQRLAAMDIHPSAPMWGQGSERLMNSAPALHDWELDVILGEQKLCDGLENARLEYRRRSIRSRVRNMHAVANDKGLALSFELQRGQFATSVLRELVK